MKARRWTGRWAVLSAVAAALALPCLARGQAAPSADRAGEAQPAAAAAPAAATGRAASAPAPSLIDPLAVLRDPASAQNDRDEAARRLILRDTSDADEALASVLADAGNPKGQIAVARAIPLDPSPNPRFIMPLLTLIGAQQPASTDAAVAALSVYADQEDVRNRIIDLATDPQHQQKELTRISALRALGTMSDKRSAQALVAVVTNAAEPEVVRSAAAGALAEMTGITTNGNDGNPWQQWWAANSSKSDADFQRDILLARASRMARLQQRMTQAAAETRRLLSEAYQVATDRNKEPLLQHYLRSDDPDVRALGATLVRSDFEQGRPVPQPVRDQLRNMVGDSSSGVRVAVAQALFFLNDAQAIDVLLQQLAREQDADVKIELIRAMVPMRDLRVVPVLLKLLHDPSPAVAQAAARGLADPDNLAPLIQKDPALAQQVANELRATLEQRGGAAAGADAIPLRVALIDAMGATRQPNLRPVYTSLLRPNQPVPVRRGVLRALGQLGKPGGDTWPANLIVDAALGDPDDAVRLEAVKALMTTADITQADRLFELVRRGTTEPNPQVREAAWQTLRNIFNDPDSHATNETLNHWANRFPVDQEPDRRIDVLKVLAGRLMAQKDLAQLAAVRQNIGEARMVQAADAARRGDADVARGFAEEAEKYFDMALQYYREKHPNDQNMTTSALVEQRMDALLASGQIDKACQFAAESIAANRGNQERMGPKLRNEVDRLADGKRYDDALRLIDAIKKMTPELADPFRSAIRAKEQTIRQQLSAERGGAAAGSAAGPVGTGQ